VFLRHATGALLILIASVLPGLGQGGRGTYGITGTVRDDVGQRAMQNVRVDLRQSNGAPTISTFTSGGGEFQFTGVPTGDCTTDYEPYRETITIYKADRRGLAVFLRRPVTVLGTHSGATISAHELSVPRKAHDEYEKALGLVYFKSDYKGAITQFQRAVKDFPNFYEAYAEEGNTYTFLGEMGPAEEAMRKSVALSSSQYPEALFLLAGLLNNTKRFAEAETLSRQGVALDAASWQGHFEMARALNALKQPEEAEKSAIQARDLKPDSSAVYLILANIHIQMRAYPALMKDLDSYLKLSPAGPEADQARKTRDDLQARMRSEQVQSRQSDEKDKLRSRTQDLASSKVSDQAQSNGQDPPLLPPLPPPQPEP